MTGRLLEADISQETLYGYIPLLFQGSPLLNSTGLGKALTG